MVFRGEECLFTRPPHNDKNILAFYCTIITATTYIIYRFAGWPSQDLLLAAMGLYSIYILFNLIKNKEFSPIKICLSGFIVGLTCGLKLSSSVFAIPLIITNLLFIKNFKYPLKTFVIYISSMAGGFLLIDGYWMYKLYITYNNPFMPYFNGFFKSKYIATNDIFSIDFPHLSTHIKLAFPFFTNWGLWTKMLYFMVILYPITSIKFNKTDFEKTYGINIVYLDYLIVFNLFTYIYWANLLPIFRYILIITGLSTTIILLFLLKISYILSKNFTLNYKINWQEVLTAYLFIITAYFLLTSKTTHKIKLPIRISLKDTNQILYIEDKKLPQDAIVLLQAGFAVFAPFQNEKVKYIHTDNILFLKKDIHLFSQKEIYRIKELLKQNPHNIYILCEFNLERFKNTDYDSLVYIMKNNIEKRNDILKKYEIPTYGRFILRAGLLREIKKYGLDNKKVKCETVENNLYADMYLCKIELSKQ